MTKINLLGIPVKGTIEKQNIKQNIDMLDFEPTKKCVFCDKEENPKEGAYFKCRWICQHCLERLISDD
ncbi:MAG: hypothetical protein ACTSXD_06880 [Candidatus Heimdallarchaeaceae archaeon]